mgnify:CR=1 FL=1
MMNEKINRSQFFIIKIDFWKLFIKTNEKKMNGWMITHTLEYIKSLYWWLTIDRWKKWKKNLNHHTPTHPDEKIIEISVDFFLFIIVFHVSRNGIQFNEWFIIKLIWLLINRIEEKKQWWKLSLKVKLFSQIIIIIYMVA